MKNKASIPVPDDDPEKIFSSGGLPISVRAMGEHLKKQYELRRSDVIRRRNMHRYDRLQEKQEALLRYQKYREDNPDYPPIVRWVVREKP